MIVSPLIAINEMGTPASANGRPRYDVLDGLRGVAALVVVVYHVFEAFATSPLDQIVNHGYLAVDFFFLLSGFVIGLSYDGRWAEGMTWRQFALRRLIRLQPIMVAGALLGGALFYLQGCNWWDVGAVSVLSLLGAVALNALLIPVSPHIEVRGIGEMYPLNGPSWSLFFEYIAYAAYAVGLRRMPRWGLLAVAALSLGGLCWFIFGQATGGIGLGWTMKDYGLWGGLARVLFSFSVGLLMYRSVRPGGLRWGGLLGAILLVTLCALPRLGGSEQYWLNGLFELVCIGLLFPLVLYWGASTEVTHPGVLRWCRFLGELSYPLYAVHYPFIYLYIAWVKNHELSFAQSLPGAVALLVGSVCLAYLLHRFYDVPLRRKLEQRLR